MIKTRARRLVPLALCLTAIVGNAAAAELPETGALDGTSSTCSVSTEGLIVFNTTRDGNPEVYSMHPDGSHLVNLTNNAAADGIPMVNSEGERVTFASARDGNLEIYVMNVDGSGLANVTNDPGYDYDPAPNEVGDKFAWVSGRGGRTDIWVANIDGSQPVKITSDAVNATNPNWSPDGTKIVFASYRDNNNGEEIYIMNANGTGQTRLTFASGRDFYPIFTPDGSRIAFTSERDGRGQIYLMNLDGTNQVNFSNNSFNDQLPYFNYEGTKMSFQSSRDDPNGEIYIVNVDGTGLVRITSNPAVDAYPAWSEDPAASDGDWDGIPDVCDICPTFANPAQDPTDTDGDGLPDECDGCVDVDHDSYRAANAGAPTCTCTPSCAADCAPLDPAVNPGATEIPGNGKDDDCNPGTPGGCVPVPQSANAAVAPEGTAGSNGGSLDLLMCVVAAAAYGAARSRSRRAHPIADS